MSGWVWTKVPGGWRVERESSLQAAVRAYQTAKAAAIQNLLALLAGQEWLSVEAKAMRHNLQLQADNAARSGIAQMAQFRHIARI